MTDKILKSNKEWQETLEPHRYRILREKGTEPPFSGEYYHNREQGIYHCAACNNILFDSQTKFESGSGWPSFYAPAQTEHIRTHEDTSHDMKRIEVTCARCGSHLGHVFNDGPKPTGLRYCINSLALQFHAKGNQGK